MNAQVPTPSSVFREIASAIGRASAERLVNELGGLRFYVPKAFSADHDIVKAIGADAATELARYFHGTWITLPMARTIAGRRRVRELAQGDPELTRHGLAKQTGYSERQIYRILGGKGRPSRQRALFDDEE